MLAEARDEYEGHVHQVLQGPSPLWPPPDRCRGGRQARSGPHQLSDDQLQVLDAMRDACATLLPIPDPYRLSDDDLLLRFLIARQWKIPAAREMLEHTLSWRRAEDIGGIFAWAQSHIPEDMTTRSHCDGVCGFYGCDQEGYPVLWERPNGVGMQQLLKEYSREDLIRWNVYTIERGRELCKAINVDRYTVVIDLSEVSVRSLIGDTGGLRQLLQEQSRKIQEVVPEALRKLFLVNAPFGFASFWAILRLVLDPRVQEKVCILGARQPGDALAHWVPLEETPAEFGGEAVVDWSQQRVRPLTATLPFIRGCPSYVAAMRRVAAALANDATLGEMELATAMEFDTDPDGFTDGGNSPCEVAQYVVPRGTDDLAAAVQRRALVKERPPALAQLVVGSRTLDLEEDRSFALLRQRMGIPDDFLKDNFDFAKMAPGGGKGGDCMARTHCKQWWVKDLNPGDFAALTSPGFLEEYVGHVTADGGRSIICRLVALLNDGGRRMIVMSNCLPSPDQSWGHIASQFEGSPPSAGWSYLFDLKGNRDDKLMMRDGAPTPQVHKRCWKCNWVVGECMGCTKLCCLTAERLGYRDGKNIAFTECFHMTPPDARRIRETVEADVRFFQRIGLMDYSAIVGVMQLRPGVEPPVPGKGQLFAQPCVSEHQGRRYAYYWGIIDFLQLWTCGKKAAHVIKAVCAPKPISTVEPTRYGEQFLDFVRRRVLADGDVPTGGAQPPPGNGAIPPPALPPGKGGARGNGVARTLRLDDVSPLFSPSSPPGQLMQ
eukprot:TRINITY_DN14279_c0_g2_i1.p1 TRINITY_DN14279_c0_g2~~TRINITY_DN14279_c0_g2_i1.p1  ORF type:complete len:773 (+),score=262.06 TRINITY_DN14279_c0_g2_i1:85-2403(+)